MTKREKKTFIRELCRAVEREAIAKVDGMPENWDGHELREYLAEQFDACRSSLMVGSKSRRSEYRNAVITSNL